MSIPNEYILWCVNLLHKVGGHHVSHLWALKSSPQFPSQNVLLPSYTVKTQVNFEKHVAHKCTNIKPTLGMVTSCTSCVPDLWLKGINYSPYMITLIQICYVRCTNHISFSNPLWALHTQLLGSLKVGAETVTEEGFIEVSMERDPSQTFYAQRRRWESQEKVFCTNIPASLKVLLYIWESDNKTRQAQWPGPVALLWALILGHQ
jgi:hypothetical protein